MMVIAMRVLLVLSHPPLHEGSAAGRCAVALLQGLASHGVEVRALAANLWGEHGTPPADLPPVEVIDVPPEQGWPARIRRYADPRSMLARGPFAARARELSAWADVVHGDDLDAAAALRHAAGKPRLLNLHFDARRDRVPGSFSREELQLILAQRRAQRAVAHLLANSAEVAADLRPADVTVAPLALDPAHYAQRAPLDEPVAGLIGWGNWPPTRRSVQRLQRCVWPRVNHAVPAARLRLAGREIDVAAAPQDGVDIVGAVPSAMAFIRELGVLLHPLERGSGTKVKVLEAMALGVPVVTTRAGAEGIRPNDGVVVVDDDAALAGAAVELLADAQARRERGAAGRATFLAEHAPAPATRPIVALYERISG